MDVPNKFCTFELVPDKIHGIFAARQMFLSTFTCSKVEVSSSSIKTTEFCKKSKSKSTKLETERKQIYKNVPFLISSLNCFIVNLGKTIEFKFIKNLNQSSTVFWLF